MNITPQEIAETLAMVSEQNLDLRTITMGISLNDAAELEWPVGESEEYETIAGFVLDLANHLPRPGEVFEKDGYVFRVQSMRRRRMSVVRVIAPEPQVDGDSEPAGDNAEKIAPKLFLPKRSARARGEYFKARCP